MTVLVYDAGGRVIADTRTNNGTVSFDLAEGRYRVDVRATNTISFPRVQLITLRSVVLELLEGAATSPVTADNNPPSITHVVVRQADVKNFDILVTAVDADGDPLTATYKITSGSATIIPDGLRADAIGESPFSIRITVSDGSGGTSTADVNVLPPG